MKVYEVVERCYNGSVFTTFGTFSTREKAEELMKMFDGLDGFGVAEDDLEIVETELEIDVISKAVLEFIEECKQRKTGFESRTEES